MKLMQDSIDAARQLIQQLKEFGSDYSKYELKIAEEMFEKWNLGWQLGYNCSF